jgi:hypothetical protein
MAAKPSRRGQITVGLMVIAIGLGIGAIAASHLGQPAGKFDPVVGLIAGLAFAFAGAILVVPERRVRIRASFGALMITSIALLFDWVAFGPGERRFTSGISGGNSGVRTHLWQMPGQILFVSGAVLFNLMAMWAWLRARRAPRKRTARA